MSINNVNLRQKVITGSSWMFALRIAHRSVGFISALILTRFLTPEDYGLVAMGLLILSFFGVFTKIGFQQKLIQKDGDIEKYLNTAWTLEILKGVLIFLFIFFTAPVFLKYFKQLAALRLVRVMGIIPLIYSFTNIRILYFQKNMKFYKQFVFEISGVIVGLSVAISAAILLRNAWALVYGQIAAMLIPAIISYFYYPCLPVLTINKKCFREMFSFGKWILIGSIMSYIVLEGDKYFVLKVFGVSMLGLYKMAFMIAHISVQEIKQSVGKVIFPAYAKLQNDKEKLKNAILKAYESMFLIISPIAIGIALVANDFGSFVLGKQWASIGEILKLLALASFTRGLLVCGSGIFIGIGKPKKIVIIEGVKMLVLIAMLTYFPFCFGINGIAYSLIIANIVGFLLFLFYLKLEINIEFIEIMRKNTLTIVSLISVIIVVSIFKQFCPASLMRLIVSVILGAVTYMLMLFYLVPMIFHREAAINLKTITQHQK